jgi:hypothetical protein
MALVKVGDLPTVSSWQRLSPIKLMQGQIDAGLGNWTHVENRTGNREVARPEHLFEAWVAKRTQAVSRAHGLGLAEAQCGRPPADQAAAATQKHCHHANIV